MKKIETYSNWCYIDRLDGRDIDPEGEMVGELVNVLWPDKTLEKGLLLCVERSTERYTDHGTTGTMPNHKAYLQVDLHGLTQRVYLRGTNVLLERCSDLDVCDGCNGSGEPADQNPNGKCSKCDGSGGVKPGASRTRQGRSSSRG